ncbi:P-loop containing nucleoside triphosphate hydrolase protein [Scheffersomyces xylosifermentans]|uniref:P-loop containing nucleoside triphosphate hydrolase protein n=1 Tax=Scheffersomyces xylosifermentans TaxID=1304137 RepID=UPI00315C4D78
MSQQILHLLNSIDINNGVVASNGTALSSCSLVDSIARPLYDPHKNALNPCFLSSVNFLFNVAISIAAIYQIVVLLFFNSFGPYKIKYSFGSPFQIKSVGIFQLVKLNSVLLQAVLTASILSLTFVSFENITSQNTLFSVFSLAFIVLPLHVIESTRSIIPSASLLVYWLWYSFSYLIILIQDSFSAQKIFLPANDKSLASLIYVIEIALFLNSVSILALETALYKPSLELLDYYKLNDWDFSSVRHLFSELSFYWLKDTISSIYETNTVELKDVPSAPVTENKLKKIAKPTEEDKKLPWFSLFLVLFKVHWFLLAKAFIIDLCEMLFSFGQAFLFQRFIIYFSNASLGTKDGDRSQPVITGIAIATGIFLCAACRFISTNRYYVCFFTGRSKMQSSLISFVYQKALRLSPGARKGKSTGDIVNNLSVDVFAVADIPRLVEASTMPIRLISSLAALYKIIGPSSISGFVAAAILVPLSSKVSTSIWTLYNDSMTIRDERTRLTSEILNSIKSIKLYSWEKPMLERLFSIRNDRELVLAKRIGIFNACSMFLWSCIPFVVSCACLVTFAYLSNVALVPSIAFPALTLFEILSEPILLLPDYLAQVVEINVSLKRLREMFLLEELEVGIVERSEDALGRDDVAIKAENATFTWSTEEKIASEDIENDAESEDTNNIALEDINFTAKKGQLTCVVGRVGSGKTTLIRALLGEIPLKKSENTHVKVNGTIAYCSQSPWIMNASVKENILFGCRYNKFFYQRTIEACQLLSDFEVLPDGDRTIVGEKGISLSGGQKARVALARSVYARADVYFLDDVLSAVDAHVGKRITNEVLGPNGLLASKTVVLATNAVNVLHQAHEIVLLKKGKIVERGNFDEVMEKGSDLAELIKEFGSKKQEGEDDGESSIEAETAIVESTRSESISSTEITGYTPKEAGRDGIEHLEGLERIETNKSLRRASLVSFAHDYEDDEEEALVKKSAQSEEKGAKGEVKLSVYLEYFKACNYSYLVFYVLCFGCNVAAGISANYILKYWSEKNLDAGHNVSPILFLSIYAGLGISAGLFTLFGSMIVWVFCVVRASQYFHDKMANSVLRSPMSFFETTPVGRIINRFADDINVIDQQIIWSCLGFVDYLMNALGLISVIVYNLPLMFFVIAILFVIYNQVRSYFIPASRELKRLASAQKSPIFSHLQESVAGVETIRAYGQEDRFIFKNTGNIDNLVRLTFMNVCCNRWLSMRLQSISAFIVYTSTLLILATLGTSRELSPGLVGFIMINALSITGTLNAIIRFWADIETRSVSVERVIEYCNLKPEAATIVEDHRPVESWPETGAISFKNYTTKYRENLDPVLKDISIDIKPREKIGIVGRTGAGKSTLSLAVFRIIEPTGGYIEIDGVNTSTIGLYDLRHKLNIIPQDAHAIEGSVRQNLDPFDQHTDEELWKVLEMAHLKEHIAQMKTKKEAKEDEEVDPTAEVEYEIGLAAKVQEGGSNLSSGQRQLLSLARALLNPSRVLILDEATAAVDVQTDKIIQETIRKEFNDKTILTIAHRLETILDSDRVLVLERGEVKEFDAPKALLSNEDSMFYSLCKEGGYLNNLDIDKLK